MPPISGSDRSRLYSLGGVARGGATRAGHHSAKVFLSINGVQRAHNRSSATSKVLIDSLTVTENSGGEPSTATVESMGFDVATGHEVIATLGSINNLDRMFGGFVLATDQAFAAKPANRTNGLRLIDYRWQLNRIKVIGRYSGPADEIVTEIMTAYAPDWSLRKVEAGLDVIDEITFIEPVDLTVALNRIAARIGATWTGDYRKRLIFGVTDDPSLTNPRDLTTSNSTFLLNSFGPIKRDRSQQITRVHMEGGGSDALAEIAPGATQIALREAADTWFGDVGGVVVSGPQRIAYTTRIEGGGGSLVGPGASPSSAPTLNLAAGSGVDIGTHDITVVFKTAAGRSLPSPVASVEVGLVAAPSAPLTAGTPGNGGLVDAGAHNYSVTYVTAAGQTTPSPASNTVTAIAGQANPSGANGIAGYGEDGFGGSGSLTHGVSYRWKYGYRRSSDGAETLQSGYFDGGAVPFPTLLTGVVNLTTYGIAAPSGYVLTWYRSNNGGASYAEVLTFNYTSSGGSLQFRDGSADGTLGGAPPVSNTTTKGTVSLSGIPVSSSPLVVSKNLYRNDLFLANIAAAATTYTDTTANSGLGSAAPSTNTAAAGQIALSGIAIGAAAVTDREIYMSPAGGGDRKLALTIADNTTTTGTITMSDATLAGQSAEPTSDTSTLAQPTGQILPGATSVVVAGLAPFQPGGGWAFTGTQQILYTGFTGSSLTGIPSSGVGSIQQTLNYNTVIAAAPMLTGIPSSGEGSIVYTIQKGDPVNIWVTVDDLDQQASLSALLDPLNELGGAAGIIEDVMQDRRLSKAETLLRAQARLDVRSAPSVSLNYQTLDKNTHPGRTVIADIDPPTDVNETLKVQQVVRRFSDANPPIFPTCDVTASDELFTFEQLLRMGRGN